MVNQLGLVSQGISLIRREYISTDDVIDSDSLSPNVIMQVLFPVISPQKGGLTGVPCCLKGVDCVKFSSVAPKVLKKRSANPSFYI